MASTVWLFPDDVMIYMAVQNDIDGKILQKDLDQLCIREAKWMMDRE